MILRYDRRGIEIPSDDPDPAGAMAVQELMAAEEYRHIEVVGATITTMLTGADMRQVVEQGNSAHVLKAGITLTLGG
jgi:Mn-containing catalase